MITVAWTPLAQQRFINILDKVAEENKATAATLSQTILKKVRMLAQFPEMGRMVPEFHHKFTRELIENNYRIIYRFNSKQYEIIILTIRHVREQLVKKETE